jgi:hypothetical protein
MKTVTIKLGDLLLGKLELDDHVMITQLLINNVPVITHRPLVITPSYPLTITVADDATKVKLS